MVTLDLVVNSWF